MSFISKNHKKIRCAEYIDGVLHQYYIDGLEIIVLLEQYNTFVVQSIAMAIRVNGEEFYVMEIYSDDEVMELLIIYQDDQSLQKILDKLQKDKDE